ncbi:MAG: GAF domain-containing protein [Pseudonocardia sp.]|uniref:sensor histidine kinase n=1 Tax=Pseudonocardia sp. TaxID=60912 RepID=UPI001AD0B36E|nr:GAF domain-containing protein [Pseudonocardia sp.]MBN9101047.1 GAF domain-containing protein [Pseudonocardia sp.]
MSSPAPDAAAQLTFPDQPRLELDELLGQLVGRAQEVMGAQGRLRGLLQATQLIGADLGLPVVLRRVVQAARELIGARYAALGVIAADGHLAEFIHTGMDAGQVERIGHLPQGKGLLGALIDDATPIRLVAMSGDDRSVGFPPDHPPMGSFLGVPIRVRGKVFGNLYLTESTRGEFSAEDEELAKALAAAAGSAIDHARLYEVARTRQQWLEASAAITRRMLTGPPGGAGDTDAGRLGPLRFVAERSRALADADLVTVVLPADGPAPAGGADPGLRVVVAVGTGADDLLDGRVAVEGTLSGQVFTTAEPVRVAHSRDPQGPESVVSAALDVGAVMVVPLTGAGGVNGVLTAARTAGRPEFTADDLAMAAGFANQASVAIELADARAQQARVAMADERERIAADLHDHVIQRLFATGLSLQSAVGALGTANSAGPRITGAVRDLDDTIRQIRTTIFGLHTSPMTRDTVRGRLMQVVTDTTACLPTPPALRFSGLLDALPDPITEDLVAVLRESLTNVARHAHASITTVDIDADTTTVTLQVTDDGIGVPETGRRSGLDNLRHRAEHHGGTLTLTAARPTGTHLRWTVPI